MERLRTCLLLLATSMTLPFLTGNSVAGQAPSKPTDATAISALIEQLSSADFQQRKAATRALEKIGRPALEALREAADKHADAEVRRRAKALVEKIERSLELLLEDYRALGLPLPPKEAKLVRYEAGGGGIVNRKVQPKSYSLAFEVKPATKTENPVLLTGTHEWQPRWNPHTEEVRPDSDAVQELAPAGDAALVLAIQCHTRGWDKLAQFLQEKSQKQVSISPRNQLVQLAWYYWEEHLTQPKLDRAPIAKRLKDLIQRDKKLDTEPNRALLKSLDLALLPSKAKPGSIEALIDDLVDYESNTGTVGLFEPEDRYWRVAKLGFEAVPTLIQHLDDDRLTRAMMMGFNNFRSWNLRVRDVLGDLLEGLAAEELTRGTEGEDVGGGWLRRQQGYRITAAAAEKWWKKAQNVGEEAYLLSHVLPALAKEGEPGHISPHLLNLILAKYPKHIPSLYRKVLDERPELDSWLLADVFLRCKLPYKDKLDVFLHAAKHKDNQHRLPAFHAIKDLDKKAFTSLLLATIEGFPKDVSGEYWVCPEAHIARLVIESDDPRVWKVLEKVAKRSALGLRMELLNHFSDPKDGRHRPERLRLLASFLDDSALRDEDSDKRFDGPGAGFPYHKIEVRDFVALQIAYMLRMEIELNLERTPEEWAKIRSQVQEAMKLELDKSK
jgi:hypothetical protein